MVRLLRRPRIGPVAAAFAAILALVGCVAPGGVVRFWQDGAAQPVDVAVETGVLEGVVAPAGKVWLGIPYARAPLGSLRWRAPLATEAWTGVRPARRRGREYVQNLSP